MNLYKIIFIFATIENKPRKKYLKEFLNNIFNNTKKI